MRMLRSLSEKLLQLVYLVAWAACWAQGTAFVGAALVALTRPASTDASPWVRLATRASMSLGAIFVAGGVLLLVVRLGSRASTALSRPDEPAPARPHRDTLLGVSLLGLAA